MSGKRYAGGAAARYLLLGSAVFLTLCGLVMIYSASFATDYVKLGDSAYHVKQQVFRVLVGCVVLFVLSRLDYRKAKRFAWHFLVVTDVMLVLVLTSGVEKWGARRWLYLGPIGPVQPSEFAKLAVIVALAALLSDRSVRESPFVRQMGLYGVVLLPVALFVMMQPDMGTTMTILVAGYVLLGLGGVAGRYLFGIALAAAAAVPPMIFLEGYRARRFLAFLDPWKDAQGDGYQIIQARYAFASGGLDGVGLGLSRQKYFYLPAAHTDFIFAIVGEELGLIGTLAVLAGFAVLAYAGIRVAIGAKDRFGKLLAGGVTAMIVLQAVMNVAAVTGLMPVTGIPLPLLSYGGSSVIFTLACVGIVLSVSGHGAKAERRRAAPHHEEDSRADTVERRWDGRPRLSSIDGGRAPARRRA